MSDLPQLIEHVKAAIGPDRKLDRDLWKALCWQDHYREIVSGTPFTASIDAALALVEKCLPMRHVTIDRYQISDDPEQQNSEYNWRVWIGALEPRTFAHASTIPLALLAALLTALKDTADV